MSYFRKEDYSAERQRPNLLTNYIEQMTQFLQLRNPQVNSEIIEGFVKQTVEDRYKSPTVEVLFHPHEGETVEKTLPLDQYVLTGIRDNILTPSGTCYFPVQKKESFLRISIDEKVKERNSFKKQYLAHEAQGEKREAQYYYQNQANAKIFNNAIAGGMGMKQFIMSCKAGFNSITSSGRISVKQGYSYIERAVNGNIYLISEDAAIGYVLTHIRHIPSEFEALIHTNELNVPSVEQVTDYLITSVRNYTTNATSERLESILQQLTPVQLSYVFYAGSLFNLFRNNEDKMRAWIDSCFVHEDITDDMIAGIELDDIKNIDGDVVNAVLASRYKLLGEHPDKPGRWNSLKDAAKNNPQGLKAFIYCCQHFVSHFEKMIHILRPVLQIEATFARLTMQNKMARYTVPLSDTDSNIFSTQELIKWKCGKICFTPEAYETNSLLVFIISQVLEHIFARLSSSMGAEGNDVYKISMKNEFLYPVVIVTALAKHYLAIATMQEGSLLPNPRKDIKGVGFRSSAYPKLVNEGFEEFVVKMFALIHEGEPIKAAVVLDHVAQMEHKIFTSIHENRESVYLQTGSIRREQDYKDPSQSNYFYYKFWQEVFAPSYGEMVIPNKCFKIPLKGGAKFFKNKEYMAKLQQKYPDIYERLERFLADNPNRNVSAIYVPPFKGKLQPLFVDVMDLRTHISQVLTSYYHLLDALGVGTCDRRANGLVSDFFNPSTALLE